MPSCVIADNSKIIRMLLVKIMENFGYDVVEAEDGEVLQRICDKEMPDIIICDWQLPIVDGTDILYKLRSDKKIKQPIFIFCSYIKNIDIMAQALSLGADDYIMRPFDEDIIASKLQIINIKKKAYEL